MKLDIIDYHFYDDTDRKIYVLRPEEFEEEKEYNTLYMFDGKATFIGSEYTNDSWRVKETFEEMDVKDWIVVAIDNAGDHRLEEYLPADFEHHGKVYKSRHAEFDAFFFEDLMPYIEENYPVKKDRESRALAGSSMGGIMTASYAGKYKDVFSKYGIFSLASWMSHDDKFIGEYLEEHELSKDAKYFVYVGDREGYNPSIDFETEKVTKAYLKESDSLIKYFKEKGIEDYIFIIGEGHNHSEKSWSTFFPDFVKYIL